MMPRLVFMGSPGFALPILQNLVEHYPVVGVVTQPDRPAGRGRLLTPPPIKILAKELNLPVIQPLKLREPEAMQQLRLWSPGLIVVAAFGQILRPDVLDMPQFGCINVHASLLPRWRGAAPVQAALLNGDDQTGVTIMHMDPGIDTGPMLSQRSLQIKDEDTAGSLISKLSNLGASLLIETLPRYISGELLPQPQANAGATYAPMIKKEDGLLDFSRSAIELERKIRAFNPSPGAFTYWKDQPLKIHRAHAVDNISLPPGKRIIYQELPAITTSFGILVLDELQLAGKNILKAETFLHGARNWSD